MNTVTKKGKKWRFSTNPKVLQVKTKAGWKMASDRQKIAFMTA